MSQITDWETFVHSSRSFFDARRETPLFQLIQSLDDLYQAVHANGPFPLDRDNFIRKCFVICHWAMLAAATNTASGLPDVGPAITRRALEAAKVCLAIKAHPDNFDEWQAFEQRSARWSARASGYNTKGAPISPRYRGVSSDPFYREIQGLIGVLSDAVVHFTPEYFDEYIWKKIFNRDGTVDISFTVLEDAVPYRCSMLIMHYLLMHYLFIVRVFDHCLDGKLFMNANITRSARKVIDRLKELLELEGLSEQASMVEREWRFLPNVSDA